MGGFARGAVAVVTLAAIATAATYAYSGSIGLTTRVLVLFVLLALAGFGLLLRPGRARAAKGRICAACSRKILYEHEASFCERQ